MEISTFIETMNRWGQTKVPFLFAVDFEMEQSWIIKLSEIDPSKIRFQIGDVGNTHTPTTTASMSLEKKVIPLDHYKQKFDVVMSRLEYGDTFLTNLTIKT